MGKSIILVLDAPRAEATQEFIGRNIWFHFVMERKGTSYFEADMDDYDTILKWWMVSPTFRKTMRIADLPK